MGQGHYKIKPKDITELAASTDFSEEEVKEWYRSFIKDYPSGRLTQEQFANIFSNLCQTENASSYARHIFRSFDKNGDGTMDFREFLCSFSATTRGTFDQKLRWAFSVYDTDNNGYVTKNEMLVIIQAMYKNIGQENSIVEELTPQERVDKMFSKMDKDGDESVTLEEFKIAVDRDPSLVMQLQMGRPLRQEIDEFSDED